MKKFSYELYPQTIVKLKKQKIETYDKLYHFLQIYGRNPSPFSDDFNEQQLYYDCLKFGLLSEEEGE